MGVHQSLTAISSVLMWNNAPCHTAKARQYFPTIWRNWLDKSSDLNPIEIVWARLKEAVFEKPIQRSRQFLVERVQRE